MRKSKRKTLLGVLIIVVLVLCIGLFMKNKTNTLNSNSIKEGITKELDENLIGAYIQNGDDYTPTSDIPTSGYEFNAEKSYCKIGDVVQEDMTLSYDMDTQTLTVSPITKEGMKCYLYFDEHKIPAGETILAHYSTVLTRRSFSSTVTKTTTGTIYKSANESQYDDDGEVYYFAGNPTDNWFYFGGYYWRIVRINGDGSIRLIYNGTSTNQAGDSTMINTSQAFNSSYNDNMYVGYMYQSGQVHGLTTNSSIKTTLDSWYLSNLADEAEYLDGNAGFCGDRTPYSGSGTGTTQAYYAAFNRLANSKKPSFKCTYEDASGVKQDLYTTPGSSKGNGVLKVSNNDDRATPIGLITVDEVAFAGGVYNQSNTSYYLYNNAEYWTMSPSFFDSAGYGARVFTVDSSGYPYPGLVYYAYGVRPVINLKSAIAITGSGTTDDPFKVG